MPKQRLTGSAAAEPDRVAAVFAAAWARRPDAQAVLAVSGGSDSTALLRLVVANGATPPVVTVDHGLRADSTAEAAAVAQLCRELGLEHATLAWRDRPEGGNLQAEARAARYRLIADWAAARGIGTVVTGHTLDDQAETVLMRLARGSGVDGLAAMRETARLCGMTVFRPMLGITREDLRDYLTALGQGWFEDPSNIDPRYDRVKVRDALVLLAPLGMTPERLADTARHTARAADALEGLLDDWAYQHLERPPTGEVRLPRVPFAGLSEELRLRLLARLLGRVSGRVHRPRFDSLAPIEGALAGDGAVNRALHGCLVRADADRVMVLREPAAVAPPQAIGAEGGFWDGRWQVWPEAADVPSGLTLGTLGEAGLAALSETVVSPGWQAAPRLARLTTPAVWQGEHLYAAPVAGAEAARGWLAELLDPRD